VQPANPWNELLQQAAFAALGLIFQHDSLFTGNARLLWDSLPLLTDVPSQLHSWQNAVVAFKKRMQSSQILSGPASSRLNSQAMAALVPDRAIWAEAEIDVSVLVHDRVITRRLALQRCQISRLSQLLYMTLATCGECMLVAQPLHA
jgi:hypothetical protein